MISGRLVKVNLNSVLKPDDKLRDRIRGDCSVTLTQKNVSKRFNDTPKSFLHPSMLCTECLKL